MLQRLPRMETPAPRTEKETKEMTGIAALQTLRLSGVDWQRLAAEE